LIYAANDELPNGAFGDRTMLADGDSGAELNGDNGLLENRVYNDKLLENRGYKEVNRFANL